MPGSPASAANASRSYSCQLAFSRWICASSPRFRCRRSVRSFNSCPFAASCVVLVRLPQHGPRVLQLSVATSLARAAHLGRFEREDDAAPPMEGVEVDCPSALFAAERAAGRLRARHGRRSYFTWSPSATPRSGCTARSLGAARAARRRRAPRARTRATRTSPSPTTRARGTSPSTGATTTTRASTSATRWCR